MNRLPGLTCFEHVGGVTFGKTAITPAWPEERWVKESVAKPRGNGEKIFGFPSRWRDRGVPRALVGIGVKGVAG